MQLEKLGPYKLDKILGRGGMGAVYVARNEQTGEQVAVKLLAPHLSDDRNFRERFKIEVETLKKLLHPNIVQLFGYGEEEGHLFYSMELVHGHSLQDELSAGRRFTWREVTRIGIDVAKALKHAHDRGVIHRDLKPANLLIDSQDHVKLTDFGIAKLYGGTQITADGGVLGTADYMSPEQAAGIQATSRCDLYSLGSVLYALLAGRPPFASKSLPEVIHNLRFEKPASIARLAPDIPDAFAAIIMQLLEKDPQKRVPTAMALANRLKAMEHALSLETRVGNDDGGLSVVADDDLPALSNEGKPPQPRDQTRDRTAIRVTSEMPNATWDDEHPVRPLGLTTSISQAQGAAQSAIEEWSTATGEGSPAAKLSHFTTVSEAELRRSVSRDTDDAGAGQWLRIGLLLLGTLCVLGLIVWFSTRPPSADALFARIEAAAREGDALQLIAVENDMQRFLDDFPDDPRGAELRGYQEDLELFRLERRFEVRSRRIGGADSLLPIERAYLEALQLSTTDPAAAVAKFQALVDLFALETAAATPQEKRIIEQCVDLSRRQVERLGKSVAKMTAEQRSLIERQLERANQLAASNQTGAETIWKSIIELYGEKSWAADLVAQARERLQGK